MADSPSPFPDQAQPPPPPPVHLLESFDANQLLEYLRHIQVKAEQWTGMSLDQLTGSIGGEEDSTQEHPGTGEEKEVPEPEGTSCQRASSA